MELLLPLPKLLTMEKERINKIFEKWVADEVEMAFGISESNKHDLLDKWLASTVDLEEYEQKMGILHL
jgi:hypothetical protein